ncbi:TonB-dependent receptor [Sphingopyxis sp. CCNWLW253]|uniref:TonB-dependent receptor n=1 Tax=unclassified Sphingopyxis TaxID=2614943 RepID=UPI0030129FAA
MKARSKQLLWTAACSAALSAMPAQAQSEPPQTTTGPGEQADESDQSGLDIVVTAQRREERMSQVPISVTAFSGDALATTGVADTRALTQVTPGLNFQSVGSSAQPVIRGIGSSGSSVGDSSNVAIYVDGVYQPFQAANYLQFVDLERIEVLKGPQGTLFGRNAAGGAINITTKTPSFDLTGRLGVSYGRFDEFEAMAFVNVPVVDDKVAWNISADYLDGGAYRRDINLDRKLGYKHFHTVRSKLLVKLGDRVDVVLAGYYARFNDLTTFGNQPLDGNTQVRATLPNVLIPTEKNTSALGIVPLNRVKTGGGSLRITVDMDWATLTSLSAFSKARQSVVTDSDLTPVTFSESRIRFGDDMISQDLVLASASGGRFTWLAGASYYRERGFYHLRSYGGEFVFNPNPRLTFGTDVDDIRIDAYAAFGEATFKLTDRLTLIGGLRYSRDEPGFSGNTIVTATGLPGTFVSADDHFEKLTPRASIRYALTPSVNAYASYSRGFKSGVFNGNSLQVQAVNPESVDAFEIGIKGAPSRKLTFDTAAYFYSYKDLQFSAFGTTSISPTLRNAAQAEIYGFEANMNVIPARGLTLRGGIAYTHGEYTDFTGAQGFRPRTDAAGVPIGGNTSFVLDASGQRLLRTPRLQANGTATYETDTASGGTILASVTGSYTSRLIYDLAGNFQQKGFAIFNANVAYTTPDGHWRGTIFGQNIFNAQPIAGVLISNLSTSVTYQRPAQYGLKLEYLF